MATGTVKWWNDERGYGFIKMSGGRDAFVHCSNVQVDDSGPLEEGQVVEFDVEPGQRGPIATYVRLPGSPKEEVVSRELTTILPPWGVKAFTQSSLRRIEYQVNEWAEENMVTLLGTSIIRNADGSVGALVTFASLRE